jgi:transposase
MGPKRALDKEQESELVRRYLEGESARSLGFAFGVSAQTACNTIKRLGVETREDAKKKHLTDAERKAVVAMCQGGGTTERVAETFGCSRETVFRVLREVDVKLPSGRPRQYDLNEAAFDELTPESLYWLGFFFADGCLYGNNTLILSLAKKDEDHLRKFKLFLGAGHPIHTVKPGAGTFGGTCVRLSVKSTRLFGALTSRGVSAKKVRSPVEALLTSRDFWRGAVDGDGWLGVSVYNGVLYPNLGLSGQRHFVQNFCDFLISEGLSSLTPRPSNSGIYRAQTSGNVAGEVVKKLYEDACVSLDRKYERAKLIMSNKELSKSVSYVNCANVAESDS